MKLVGRFIHSNGEEEYAHTNFEVELPVESVLVRGFWIKAIELLYIDPYIDLATWGRKIPINKTLPLGEKKK